MLIGDPVRARRRALATGSFPAFALLYFALFSAFGTESPFFPSFLSSRGLSPTQIGALLSAGLIVRLALGPLLGVVADAFGTRRVLAGAAILSGLLVLLYLPRWTFWPLLIVSLAHSAATASLNPLADALALTAASKEGSFAYGWVRGIGSASFVLGVLAAGELVGLFGLDTINISAAVLFLIMVLPIGRLPPAPGAGPSIARESLPILLANRPFLVMLLAAGLVIGSHALNDTFAVIDWSAAGISPFAISLLWAESVASEILVFFVVGPMLLARRSINFCAVLAALAGILRWSALALSHNVAVLGGTQLLHGLTFSLMHLTCMRVIDKTVPHQLTATAQMVYGSLGLGLASTVLTFASGRLYGLLGEQAFWAMAALCLAAVPIAWQMRADAASARWLGRPEVRAP